MQINTISRIEQFICDSLIASPLVPIGVNVMRLADAAENEGVVTQANTIIVRFVNSSSVVKNKVPFIYEKTLFFELNFLCQSYLSSSGHDFATQLLSAAEMTISGSSPSGALVQVVEPFHCTSSQFTGIDESSSQYTYSQTYGVMIEEVLPFISLDPCVQRGDCSKIFPGSNVLTQLPLAGVIQESSGSVYVPWWPNADPAQESLSTPQGVRWSNEIMQSGDWVFASNPEEVFIEDPLNQPIYLLSNNSFTEDGRLVVTIWDAQTREPLREVFYVDTGKRIARYVIELWRNAITFSKEGSSSSEVKEATWTTGTSTGEFAVVRGSASTLYSDPLSSSAGRMRLSGGTLIGVDINTFIQTPNGRFFLVIQSPQGKGWLRQDSFEVASLNSLWKLGCLPCEGGQNPSALAPDPLSL
jgi:hypothetical protein